MTSRFFSARAAALAALLAFAVGLRAGPRQAGPQTSDPADISVEHAMGTRLKAKGIPNFGRVTPNLYRGAVPSNEGIEALKKLGIDVVVDLRGGHNRNEEAAATQLGMQYISIPSHCPFPRMGLSRSFCA